jgi:hypothetical protein
MQMSMRADIAQICTMKMRDSMPKTVLAAIEAVHVTLCRQGVDQVMGRADVQTRFLRYLSIR